MRASKKKNTYDFDENFEVTYEEEIPFSYTLEPNPKKRQAKKASGTLDFIDPSVDERSASFGRSGKNRQNRYDLTIENPDHGYDGYYDDDYDDTEDYGYEEEIYESSPSSYPPMGRQRRKNKTPLAAPIRKGSKTIYRISQTILRNLSLVLILAVTGVLAYNFLRGSAPYGDIENAVSSRDYTQMLAAYFAVAAFFILFELLSALWAMSKVRVRDEFGIYKEDVGRGLFSFVFIYLCSYASFWVSRWIPEIHDLLKGIRGALDVFGSMHNLLFGLCAAGVASCLLRKYSLSL